MNALLRGHYLEIIIGPILFSSLLGIGIYYFAPAYQYPFWRIVLPIACVLNMILLYMHWRYVLSNPDIYKPCSAHDQYPCFKKKECMLENMPHTENGEN
jgi:hypothetical protein